MTRTVLDTITTHKRKEVAAQRPQQRDFVHSLRTSRQQPAIIAEFKIASPSVGVIAAGIHLDNMVDYIVDNLLNKMITAYTDNGAAAISILTDETFFHGSLDHLRQAKQRTHLPILRKDFIIDRFQVYESYLAGADAILLIVSILSPHELQDLNTLAHSLGMQTLVEVHTLAEASTAIAVGPSMIGINTRNLHTMETNLETFAKVASTLPEDLFIVAESGIVQPADIAYVQAYGASAVLIGTTLMSAADPGKELARLCK